MEARRVESPAEAAEEKASLAQRRRLRTASARTHEPRLELRLRSDANGGRPCGAPADDVGRIHTGVPGDPSRAQVEQRASDGSARGFVRQAGAPQYLRSDNGPEFVAKTLRQWLARLAVQTLYIEAGSPWENGYIESFNAKLRDELLNLESFDTLHEAQVLVERWRVEYNTRRPHSSLGYRPPAPEAFEPFLTGYGAPPLRPPKTVQLLT